jgi:hypothetical protein
MASVLHGYKSAKMLSGREILKLSTVRPLDRKAGYPPGRWAQD